MDEYYWILNAAYKAALLGIGYGIIITIYKVINSLFKKIKSTINQDQKITELIEPNIKIKKVAIKITAIQQEIVTKELLKDSKFIAIYGSIIAAIIIFMFAVTDQKNTKINLDQTPKTQIQNTYEFISKKEYLINSCIKKSEIEDGLKINLDNIYYSSDNMTISLVAFDKEREMMSTMEFKNCKSTNLIKKCEFEYDDNNYGLVRLGIVVDEGNLIVNLKRYIDGINEKADIAIEEWNCTVKRTFGKN